MTNELKPCPFCGGEATPKLAPYIGGGGCGFIVDCDKCWSQTGYYSQRDQAIAAWNTRACYECEHGAIPATEENMAEHGWVKERTCQAEYHTDGKDLGAFYCSDCGNYMDEYDRYCPTCGAKVIDKVAEE